MFNSPAWATHLDTDLASGVAKAVSRPRLASYGRAANDIEAVARHGRNILLSEAMYPVLHMLEVVMRNSLHDAFREHLRTEDWYDLGWLKPGHAALVRDAKANLAGKGKPATADRVVAELRFGFWCGMFNGAYEDAGGPWPRLLPVVFPRVPKTWRTRPKVRRRIEEARLVRNRIFHHEPIAHLPDLADRHRRLIELLGWLSPEARRHVEHLCRFQPVFRDALTLLR
jgi:hypothetical protein